MDRVDKVIEIIEKHGIQKKFAAEIMGITPQRFSDCLNGRKYYSFKESEINKLIKYYEKSNK